MAEIVRPRVRASSIIEVLISMVIIMVVFGIALAIFDKITHSSVNGKNLLAQGLLKKELAAAEFSKTTTDSIYVTDDLTIARTFSAYAVDPALTVVRLSAINDKQDTVYTIKKVLIK